MSVELYMESPGKFDSRTLSRETLSRWTGGTIGSLIITVTITTIIIIIIIIMITMIMIMIIYTMCIYIYI